MSACTAAPGRCYSIHASAWCGASDWLLALLLGVLIRRPATRGLQLAAAAALIALPALVGHAGATPGMAGNFHLVSDMVHLLAAGAWLGGLPAFALLLARARSEPGWDDVAVTATRRFSVVGVLSVGGLLASGLINSWYLLSGPRDLVTTDYGRLVALKIGLFAAMVTLAAVNRFYLTPRLPEPSALRALHTQQHRRNRSRSVRGAVRRYPRDPAAGRAYTSDACGYPA